MPEMNHLELLGLKRYMDDCFPQGDHKNQLDMVFQTRRYLMESLRK